MMGDLKKMTIKMARAIAKFFHYNKIPPNVESMPYYQALVDTIVEVGPWIKPPSAYKIGG